jgi:hypothetical protein
VSKFTWHTLYHGHTYYARTNIKILGKWTLLYLHQLILRTKGKRVSVDHIDSNGLNNLRQNLRKCTQQQNNRNQRKHITKTSRFKGVYYTRLSRGKKWRAGIAISGKTKSLGSFNSELEAKQAYNKAAKRLFGRYARIN